MPNGGPHSLTVLETTELELPLRGFFLFRVNPSAVKLAHESCFGGGGTDDVAQSPMDVFVPWLSIAVGEILA